MRKKVAIILAVMLHLSFAATAQVFIMEEDQTLRDGVGDGLPIVPDLDNTLDQNLPAPLGNGIMLLTALGGAYLIGKRRKED